ncbi:putative beta-1,6-N-acetylglucosaminyltransferase [Meyerozyma guilliermondii]
MATKNRLSLFSFGSASSRGEDDAESLVSAVGPKQVSNINGQLSSPMNSPVSEVAQEQFPASEDSAEPIFERSVQNVQPAPEVTEQPRCSRCNVNRSRSCTHNSSISLSGQFFKNEDCIPPALDASTQILSNKNTNLDDVEMVYSNRRNSSVVGLNAALGRPFAPSRKNSALSIHSQSQFSPSTLDSPVSPPRLNQSRSSLSFYSYADMVNNDETWKSPPGRPGFRQSVSHSMVPTTKKLASTSRVPTMTSLKSAPVRHMSIKDRPQSNLNNYLISPDSSDSEDVLHRKSVSSDNESLVSSTIGDCLRRTTTEINGN